MTAPDRRCRHAGCRAPAAAPSRLCVDHVRAAWAGRIEACGGRAVPVRIEATAGGWRMVGADRMVEGRRAGGRSRLELAVEYGDGTRRSWALSVPGAGDAAGLAFGYVSGELDLVGLLSLVDVLGGRSARVGAEPLRGAVHIRPAFARGPGHD